MIKLQFSLDFSSAVVYSQNDVALIILICFIKGLPTHFIMMIIDSFLYLLNNQKSSIPDNQVSYTLLRYMQDSLYQPI